MAESRTTFVVDGTIGNPAKMVTMGVLTNTAAGVLKTFLNAHTDGEINAQSFSARVVSSTPPVAGDMNRRGICYFQDVATGFTKRQTIPGIKVADCQVDPGREGGERVTDAFMALLKNALQTATGKSLRSLYGVVLVKAPKAG
jgi:hypothetical protein